jgi:hypothetical protein
MRRLAAAPLASILILCAACPLATEVRPTDSCSTDKDCFTREGEYCDRGASGNEPGRCRLRRDARLEGGARKDARPVVDSPPRDRGRPETAPAREGGTGKDARLEEAGHD